MASVTFYQQSDCGKDDNYKTYTSNKDSMSIDEMKKEAWPQDDNDHMDNDISSFSTGANSWVIVFNDKNCDSDDTMTLGPNKSVNCSNGYVKSFMLYNHDPNATNMLTCWQDEDFSGRTQVFNMAKSVDNTHDYTWLGDDNDHIEDDISCLQTNAESTLLIYSLPAYEGRIAYLSEPGPIDLSTLHVDGDDMDNTIQSFQLFEGAPPVNVLDVINRFVEMYPTAEKIKHDNRNALKFYAGNGSYRVYYPQIYLNQVNDDGTNTANFKIEVQHVQGGGTDDHAYVSFSMNLDKNDSGITISDFTDTLTITYDMGSSFVVPDWAIKMADVAVDGADKALKVLADAATEALTEGAGTEALPYINKGIDIAAKGVTFGIDHINAVLNFFFKIEDDGSRLYFPAVVSHTIPRLVKSFLIDVLGNEDNTNEQFNETAFLNAFGVKKWDYSRDTPCVEFAYNNHNFRCNQPDNSFAYNNGGLLSTIKFDAITDNAKDDHISLQTIYNNSGVLFCIVGTVDIFKGNYPDDYEAPNSGVIFYDLDGNMQQITKEEDEDPVITPLTGYNSLESAFQYLMTSAVNNLETQYDDFDITDQQRDLVAVSVKALDGISAAIIS